MELKASTDGNRVSLLITGIIDDAGAAQLKEAFQRIDHSVMEVILDFSGVSHIGSAGLGKLLLLYKNLAARGGLIRIQGLSGMLRDLFRELKLDTLFQLA